MHTILCNQILNCLKIKINSKQYKILFDILKKAIFFIKILRGIGLIKSAKFNAYYAVIFFAKENIFQLKKFFICLNLSNFVLNFIKQKIV